MVAVVGINSTIGVALALMHVVTTAMHWFCIWPLHKCAFDATKQLSTQHYEHGMHSACSLMVRT